MRNKKPLWLVFILGLLVGVKAYAAEEEAPIALPAVAVSVSQEGQPPTSSAFRVVREENAVFATILADAPFNYTAHPLDSPPGYVVDMPGLVISPEQVQSVEVNSRAVKAIRFFQADQGSGPARLVVVLNQVADCRTFASANGSGLLVRVDEPQEPLTIAAAVPPQSPPLPAAVETVARLPEAEPLVAISPAQSGYDSHSDGEAPQAISVAPGIPGPAEVPSSLSAEVLLSSAPSTAPTPATVEGPEVVSAAPEIPQPAEAGPPFEEPSLASATSAAPPAEVVEERPVALLAAAPLPTAIPGHSAEAEAPFAPQEAPRQPIHSPASKPPVALAMAPFSVPSGAVVRVALVEESPSATASAGASTSGNVSVDFVDTSLPDIFKSLAFQSGRDIIVHQDVKATATLQLHDMPLEEAVNLVASMYNLSVERAANVYLIMPQTGVGGPAATGRQSKLYYVKAISLESALGILGLMPEVKAMAVPEQKALILMGSGADLAMAERLLGQVDQAGMVTTDGQAVLARVFALRYASPDAVAKAIRSAIPTLTVSVEAQLKAVTVRGSAADVTAAEQMIRELDKEQAGPEPGAAPSSTAIKVQYVSVSALAAKLEQLLPEAQITYDEALKAVFVSGTPVEVDSAKAIAAAVDVAPPTPGATPGAETEVIIRDLDYATPAEADSFLRGISDKVSVATSSDSDRIVVTFPKGLFATIKLALETFDVAPKEVVIEALITDMSRDLSKQLGFAWDFGGTLGFQIIAPATDRGIGFPNVQRGRYNITSVLRAIEGDTSSKLLARPRIRTIDAKEATILIGERLLYQIATIAGGTVVYAIREEKVGIALTVKPRITRDGHVLLTVHPEVSTLTGFNPQGYPNIATRESDSTVRLKDGETLVIGGLIREEEIASMTKVPILSEIPILGGLFKQRTRSSRPSEVLIFVTPHVIKGEEL